MHTTLVPVLSFAFLYRIRYPSPLPPFPSPFRALKRLLPLAPSLLCRHFPLTLSSPPRHSFLFRSSPFVASLTTSELFVPHLHYFLFPQSDGRGCTLHGPAMLTDHCQSDAWSSPLSSISLLPISLFFSSLSCFSNSVPLCLLPITFSLAVSCLLFS